MKSNMRWVVPGLVLGGVGSLLLVLRHMLNGYIRKGATLLKLMEVRFEAVPNAIKQIVGFYQITVSYSDQNGSGLSLNWL